MKLAIESEQPITKTAEELGLNPSTLYTWIQKYHGKLDDKSQAVNNEHIYDEVKRLRKENKRLKEERDILKKATAYFAKETM